jgi:hypothetical protein
MRRFTAMLSLTTMVLMAAGLAAQAKPSFAGDWMMVAPDGRGDPGSTLTITQSAQAIILQYTGGGHAPAPGTLTFTLDGSASKTTGAARGAGSPAAHVSKARWAGNTIVLTTTTGAGEETRTLSLDGGDLVITTTASPRKGAAPQTTKVTYTRYVLGFGG